ncbi:hypothetical protein [Rhodocaloribacter litoris]|nr:hypothetical protein [Rhodocaloribacter litoris]
MNISENPEALPWQGFFYGRRARKFAGHAGPEAPVPGEARKPIP